MNTENFAMIVLVIIQIVILLTVIVFSIIMERRHKKHTKEYLESISTAMAKQIIKNNKEEIKDE